MFGIGKRRRTREGRPATGTEIAARRLAVRRGAELLAARREQVERLGALAGVPEGQFQALYLAALQAFAEHVQELPYELLDGAGAAAVRRLPTILDVVMEEVNWALRRRAGYLLPLGAEAEVIAAKADLWTYAVYTAALARGLRRIADGVLLFGHEGQLLGTWRPYGPMGDQGASWYDIDARRYRQPYPLRERLVAMVIGRVVPQAGLDWLWQDAELIDMWLAAVSGDGKGAGILTAIVQGAEVQAAVADNAPSRVLASEAQAIPLQSIPPAEDTARERGVRPEQGSRPEPAGTQAADDPGLAFLAWLKESLAEERIKLNGTDGVHVVPEGILVISPDVFQDFDVLNWKRVQKRLRKLRVTRKPGGSTSFFAYRREGSDGIIRGTVLTPEAVLGDGPCPAPNPKLTLVPTDGL